MISSESEAAAVTDNRYPFHAVLATLLAETGIQDFDTKTIQRVIGQFTGRVLRLETAAGIGDVAWDSLAWELTDGRVTTTLNGILARTGVLVCVLRAEGLSDAPLIATRSVKSRTETRAVVQNVLTDRLLGGISQYSLLDDKIVAIPSIEQLLLAINPVELFSTDEPSVIEAGIRVALYQRSGGGDPSRFADAQFCLGAHFSESLAAHKFADAMYAKVLRACVETVLSENLPATHGLRCGPGPNDEQQTRNQDRAIRRDIDYEYHLHYWERTVGGPEFASVVTHQDFSIHY